MGYEGPPANFLDTRLLCLLASKARYFGEGRPSNTSVPLVVLSLLLSLHTIGRSYVLQRQPTSLIIYFSLVRVSRRLLVFCFVLYDDEIYSLFLVGSGSFLHIVPSYRFVIAFPFFCHFIDMCLPHVLRICQSFTKT